VNHGLFRRSPFPGAQQRVGNAERGAVLELLSRALGEGYLELDEYDNRITAVHGARTVGDLMGQVADLPPAFRWPPQPSPAVVAPMPGPAAGPVAVPYPVPGGAFAPQSAPAPVGGAVHGMAIASAVLGSISLVSAFCSGIGFFPGFAAMLLAVRPLRAGDNTARVGMILGMVGILLSIAMFALSFALRAASASPGGAG